MKMTKEQLKPLIKMVLTEMARRRSGASGEYDLEDVELDGLTVPGLATPEDMLKFDIRVEYDASPGYPDRGMFGPPEHSEQGEGASAEIIQSYMIRLEISGPQSQEYTEVDFEKLPQETQLVLNKIVSAYVDKNNNDIEEKILDSLGDNWDEPEPPERDDYDYDR